jgi:hypothetical protein
MSKVYDSTKQLLLRMAKAKAQQERAKFDEL